MERYKIEFVLLPLLDATSGAVETIQLALEKLTDEELKSNFMLMDCDTFYYEDVMKTFNNNKLENAIFYFVDPDGPPIFSYIQVKDDLVHKIKEKEKISNFANCGIFCVESGYTLKKYCSMLLLNNQRQHNEFYTSGIFDLMIEDNIEVAAIKVKDFECVGTPAQLENFLRGRI
jgi:NDP-sugar pyrophosphorylase family protein